MDKAITEQDKLYDTTLQMIGAVAQLPIIRVDREGFLREQFADSPYIEQILANGPQSVYSVDSLRKKASEVINRSTNATSLASFVAGLPANPLLMVVAGGADVAQYFGFAINMAQQIAYLFGEDDLFKGSPNQMPEDAKVRIVAYLGAMLGVGGAGALITKTSKVAGAILGKKVAARALTQTAWFPLLRKVGAMIGQQITKKTVEKVIAKAIPIIGGFVSGGLTYFTFMPMGNCLADVFVKHLNGEFAHELELNPEFVETLEKTEDETPPVIIADFAE